MAMYWVYGSNNCSWCNKSVELLKELGHTVCYTDVGLNKRLRDPNWTTIPQIFEVGKHIGGYEELVKHLGIEQ